MPSHAKRRHAAAHAPGHRALTRLAVLAGLPALSGIAAADDGSWRLGIGLTMAHIAPTAADYGTRPRFDTAGPTFPRLFVAHDFAGWEIEAGYRKLGTMRFTAADGSANGDTHSNALDLAVRLRGDAIGLPQAVSLRLGVAAVRTITQFQRRPAASPIRGGDNAWTFTPTAGVGIDLPVSPSWTLRAGYDALAARLGDREGSGRYRQQLVGIDLLHRW
jgi:hypothetical protein